MIVNSSQGGGSKDTWVLAESDGRGTRQPSRRARAAHAARACARRAGAARSSNSSRRAADARPHRPRRRTGSGRHLVRAEHTARMLDGLFHADLQGRADDPTSVTLSWDALLAIMGGAAPSAAPARRDDVVRLLTTDADNPVSIVSCVNAAREGARTLRDTIPAEMWESINTFDLQLRAARPRRRPAHRALLDLQPRQGAQRPVLGPDRAHHAEGRGARVPDRRRAHRGGRHGAAHAAGGAAAGAGARRRGARGGAAARRQRARAAARRRRASRRSCAPPPRPRTPGRSRASCSTSASSPTRWRRRCSRSTPRWSGSTRPARLARRVLRVRRMLADLDFRARGSSPPEAVAPWLRPIQQELERLDEEIHNRYFEPSTVVAQTVTG